MYFGKFYTCIQCILIIATSFFILICVQCMCAYMCVHMCMCMHMCILWCVHVHTHAWCMHRRVQRLTLNVFLNHPSLYFLRQDLSLHLEHAISARLVS